MTIKSLKEELEEELRDSSLNYGRILQLAHDLALQDVDMVRFSVDASHISRLGIELVSKQETAISELIKNAYDADAGTVDLVFKNSEKKGGQLEIIDSGTGMSRDQLLNGFMRISTRDKVSEPTSPLFGRQRAGRKGIGRFAAQRLGRRLTIKTQLQGEAYSLEVNINWDQFEAGIDLYQIAHQILTVDARPTSGTTLLIYDLRDAWSEVQIRRSFRFVSELLQPFPIDKSRKPGAISESDPGFKVAFYKEQLGDLNVIASEDVSIFAHAAAHITAHVNSDGVGHISISSERYAVKVQGATLDFEPKIKSRVTLTENKYTLLTDVQLTARYFIQEELPTGVRSLVRDVLTESGGIRVYRNGFRVLPYGEAFDDWLGLQRSSALRQLLPPHHNTNFIGFVEIIDVAGERFEETASREGLLENEAFAQLQDFAYRAIVTGVIEVARIRKKKVFAADESPAKDLKDEPRSPREKANTVANTLRSMIGTSFSGTISSSDSDSVQRIENLAEEIELIGAESADTLAEVGMLRVLASLGLTIGEFTHEVRHATAAIRLAIHNLFKIDAQSDEARLLLGQVDLLRGYLRYFDNAVTQNAHRALEVHELRDLLNEFVDVFRPSLNRQNIQVDLKFVGYDLFTRPMHKSEWASILLNLLTNSAKAIQRAHVTGKIAIAVGRKGEELYVDVSDNGDGIPEENRLRIFDAFFSTSYPASALAGHNEQVVGTGLGLKIVRDIVDAVGGDIVLVDAPAGFSTCFRITMPQAREDQIGAQRY